MTGPEALRDPDAIVRAVEPELAKHREAWSGLVAKRAKGRGRALVAALATLGVAGAVAVVTRSPAALAVGAGLAAVVAAGAYWALVAAPERRAAALIGDRVLASVVRTMEPGMSFTPDLGIPQGLFDASGLFRSPDRYSSEDGLRGRIGETSVSISEVHAEERHERRDSKGHVHVSYTTLFRGVFMIADFHKHFAGTTHVLPDTAEQLFGSLGRALQGFRPFSATELVHLEDPEFEERFVVYATDQIEARYILSTSMLRRILDLRHRWADDVRLAFIGGTLSVAITQRRDRFEPEVRDGGLDRDELERLIAELAICFDLVEDLNLNTRIWTKA